MVSSLELKLSGRKQAEEYERMRADGETLVHKNFEYYIGSVRYFRKGDSWVAYLYLRGDG